MLSSRFCAVTLILESIVIGCSLRCAVPAESGDDADLARLFVTDHQHVLFIFNGDGVVDSKDSAPVGYSSSPQNTYNAPSNNKLRI